MWWIYSPSFYSLVPTLVDLNIKNVVKTTSYLLNLADCSNDGKDYY